MRFINLSSARWAAVVALFACVAATGGCERRQQSDQTPSSARTDTAENPKARLAAARKFLSTVHPRMNPTKLSAQIDRVMPEWIKVTKRGNPKLDEKKYAESMRSRMIQSNTKSLDLQSRFVARHFTTGELNEIVAFLESPIGHKMADELPKIRDEMTMYLQTERNKKFQKQAEELAKHPDEDEDGDEDDAAEGRGTKGAATVRSNSMTVKTAPSRTGVSGH